MKSEDVLRLLDAGYTKAEIDAMLTPEPVLVSEQEVETAPVEEAPVPETAPAPAEETSGNNELQETLSGFMADLQKSITDLTKAVQSKNIQTNTVATSTVDEMNKILETYINPPGRN